MSSPVEVISFTKASEFFSALSPLEARWGPRPQDWVFRGLGEAKHGLVPRIMRMVTDPRRPCWFDYLRVSRELMVTQAEGPYEDGLRVIGEYAAMNDFHTAADRAGLPVPEDTQRLRSEDILAYALGPGEADSLSKGWPQREFLSLLALAQHYGVPTRLLDWSFKPRVAGYFAASCAAKEAADPEGALAVWALRTRAIVEMRRNLLASCDIVTAPFASNPNLSAQAGLFTLVRDAHEDVGLESVIERAYAAETRWELPPRPALVKLTLPRSEAIALLRLLSLDGISAASVFPGYGGVVQALQEERLWRDADGR